MLQLWHSLQLQLGSDPWPVNSICYREAKKKKEKKKKINMLGPRILMGPGHSYICYPPTHTFREKVASEDTCQALEAKACSTKVLPA